MAEDMISNLHDSILREILSLLPIKEAVATSVLSKRWKKIHRSVFNLDFTNLTRYCHIDNIVYSVLLPREENAPIKSFRLIFPNNVVYLPNVNKWVEFVVERRVEYLSLTNEVVGDNYLDIPKWPLPIFTSRTLVNLKLKGFFLEGFSSVSLPSLKTIDVTDMQANIRDIVLLLVGCPILENLLLIDIDINSVEEEEEKALIYTESKVKLPSLKTLHLEDVLFSKFEDFMLLLADSRILENLRLNPINFELEDEDDDGEDNDTDNINFIMQKLPLSILTSRTLVNLNLDGFDFRGFSSVRLPSLKTIEAEDIFFSSVEDLLLFLAGCPILEDLKLIDISFNSDKEFPLFYRESSFRLPSLKTLHLEDITFSNVGPLAVLLAGCPNLYDLNLIGIFLESMEVSVFTFKMWKDFSIGSSKLSKVTIHDGGYFYIPLNAFRNVDYLFVEFEKVYRSYDNFPTFHKLTCLDLYSLNYNLDLLVELLQHCPQLRNLHVDEADLNTAWAIEHDTKKWVEPTIVPQCFSSHLRRCSLRNFVGLPGDIMLAKFILKNARVLQSMHFMIKRNTRVERILSTWPKASTKCEVTFSKMQ